MSWLQRLNKLIYRHKIALIGLAVGSIALVFAQTMSSSEEFTFDSSPSVSTENLGSVIELDDDRGSQLILPAGISTDESLPLLINLHGYTGTGASQSSYTFLQEAAAEARIAYIAPTGTEDNQGSNFWNANSACCNFNNSDVDDVAFIDSLIEKSSTLANIDPKKIYLFGHSNGHFMAYAYLCSGSTKVAAIAGLAGAMNVDTALCKSRPSNILHIHGELDETILYNGGTLFGSQYTSAQSTIDQWSAINGCRKGSDSEMDLLASIEGLDTVQESFRCTQSSLELWRLPEGKHTPALDLEFARKVLAWLMGFESTRS
jgi:polyhydroxybutyrate depolymerase